MCRKLLCAIFNENDEPHTHTFARETHKWCNFKCSAVWIHVHCLCNDMSQCRRRRRRRFTVETGHNWNDARTVEWPAIFVLCFIQSDSWSPHSTQRKQESRQENCVYDFFFEFIFHTLYVCARASEWPNFRMNSIFNLCHFDKIVAYERSRRNENARSSQSVGCVTIYIKNTTTSCSENIPSDFILFILFLVSL